MKKILLFFIVATITICCSEGALDTSSPGIDAQDQFTLTLNVSSSGQMSKVDVAEAGDDWAVTWNKNDELGGWPTATTALEQSKFTISSYGAETSSFEGSLATGTTQVRFVYPFNSNLSKTASNKITLSLATQVVGNDFNHIGTNTYMVSDAFDIESQVDNASTSETILSMSHIGAAIELKLKFDDATTSLNESDYSITQIVLGSNDGSEVALPLEGELNIEDGTFATTSSGALTITSDGITDVDGSYYIRFNVFPFSVGSSSTLPLVVTFANASGDTFTADATVACGGDIERATKNALYALCSVSTTTGGGTEGLDSESGDFVDQRDEEAGDTEVMVTEDGSWE